MIRKAIFLFLFILSSTIIARAQWEKLPLYGGHIDKFVQNAYSPNEIYAIVRGDGVYISNDNGDTWNLFINDLARFGWTQMGIFDFMKASDGSYLAIANYGLWKSTDEGKTWREIKLPVEDRLQQLSSFSALLDGSIFLFSSGNQLYVSKDYGESWNSMHTENLPMDYLYQLYADTLNGLNLILYGTKGMKSSDTGKSWTEFIKLGNYEWLYQPRSFIRNGMKVIGFWTQTDQSLCKYFESYDSLRTYTQVNIDTIITSTTSSSELQNFIAMSSGQLFMCSNNDLYSSSDSGKHWQIDHTGYCWDLCNAVRGALGSFTQEGILKMKEGGTGWEKPRGIPPISNFDDLKFTAAGRDTVFAVIRDNCIFELRQSNDGGRTWNTLIKTSSLSALAASASPRARYYAIHENCLVTGIAGQVIPDTIFRCTEVISNFVRSDVFLEDMFIVVCTGNFWSYYFSTDAGVNWIKRDCPGFEYNILRILPSRTVRGRFVMHCSPVNSLDYIGMGTWVADGYGDSWKWTQEDTYGYPYHLIANDILFDAVEMQFSSDYGINWCSNLSGIADSTGMNPGLSNVDFYSQQGILYLTYKSTWYSFNGIKWINLLDHSGNPISREDPAERLFTDNNIYAWYPHRGLYALSNYSITSVDYSAKLSEDIALGNNYPNPLTVNQTTFIPYNISTRASGALRITDKLGRIIRRFDLHRGNNILSWDCKDESGKTVTAGHYFYVLITNGLILTHILTVL